MNGLFFPAHLKILNLTPFKISVCSLIFSFLRNENINNNFDIIKLFEILKRITHEYKCEISKHLFIQKILEVVCNFENLENEESSKETKKISEIFLEELESFYSRIKNINDIYHFFNVEIHDLKTKNEIGQTFLENGGWVDNFVRKCLFAFYKLSFEEIFKVYANLQLYIQEEELLTIHLTNKESENLFEHQIKELDQYGIKGVDKKVLQNFTYRHKYFFFSKDSNEEVLFECIKLSQSHCDHEGLLKCFVWIQKIYRNLGKFETATKCLSTCLIKSFENNFHLLYLISTSELSYLNYCFHTDLGDIENKKSSHNFEESVLSYSNSYSYAYKNILQFFSLCKSDFIYENTPDYYFKFTYLNLIFNLLRKGFNSLAIEYLKQMIMLVGIDKMEYDSDYAIFNKLNISNETFEAILNLLLETMEFDIDFGIEKFWKILNLTNFKFQEITNLIKLKYLSFKGIEGKNLFSVNYLQNYSDSNLKNKIYYQVLIRYLEFQNNLFASFTNKSINSNEYLNKIELNLVNFRNYCKTHKFYKFEILSQILIIKIKRKQGKLSNALYYINKIIQNAKSQYILIKAKLELAEIYSFMKKSELVMTILSDIENIIEKHGDTQDKFNFYILKIQIILLSFQNCHRDLLTDTLFKCFKFSIFLNNVEFVKTTSLITQTIYNANILSPKINFHHLQNLIDNHLNNIQHIFSIYENFILTPNEEIDLIRTIHFNNIKCLNDLKKYF